MINAYPMVSLSSALTLNSSYIDFPESRLYPKLSVKLYGKGVVLDTPADGSILKMKRHKIARAGQIIVSEIWGKRGAVGFVPIEGEGALCTSHFFLFDLKTECIVPQYLQAIFRANYLEEQLNSQAKGTTGYAAVRPKHFLSAKIPLPSLYEQRRIVSRIEELAAKVDEARSLRLPLVTEVERLKQSGTNRLFAHFIGAKQTRIGDTCEVRGGIQKSSARIPGANPRRYITVAHVQRNSISTSNPRYFEVSDRELER